jgi:hypothetical protein
LRAKPCDAKIAAMALHLVKLCVGAQSIDDLASWQAQHRRRKMKNGRACVYHTTFQRPKRDAELLDGGSLYWVIKGVILIRQPLVGIDEGTKDDGSPCCRLWLDPAIISVRPTPRRAFQGWRYLDAADAPPDIKPGSGDDIAAMPAKMRKDLAALGLL